MFTRLFLFVLLLVFNIVNAAEPQQNATFSQFLTLSDIHFDPFIACASEKTPCPLIQKLQSAPANEWAAILEANDQAIAAYKQDSPYSLVKSALKAAQTISTENHTKFVLVLGDLLAHDYRERYQAYSLDHSKAGYISFVKKTMQFLTMELAKAFPNQDVYNTIGNNDSYEGDYRSKPNGQFLQTMSTIWATLIHNKTNSAEMKAVFPEGGYYSATIQPDLRLIILNTVLFSTKATTHLQEKGAAQQLAWLQDQLEKAKSQKQKVIIAMHIPSGIDVYATLRFKLFTLVELWKEPYREQFESLLKQYAPHIMGIFAGHLHADWFQILTFSVSNSEIPVTGTPAISPLFGNNPGFKVYRYSDTTLNLIDYETYYYPLNGKTLWGKEYEFNYVYQRNCRECNLIDGMKTLQPANEAAEFYKTFYSVNTASQPITTQWNPYYWCAVHETSSTGYKHCIA